MVASRRMCPDPYIRSICAFTLPGGQIPDQKHDRASKWNQRNCPWDEHMRSYEFVGSKKPNPLHQHLRWSRMTWCWSSVVKPMRPQHFRGMGHGRRRTMAESSGSDQGFFHFEAVEIGWNDLQKGGRVWKLQSFYLNLLKTSKSAYEDVYLDILITYTYYICMYVADFNGFSCRDALKDPLFLQAFHPQTFHCRCKALEDVWATCGRDLMDCGLWRELWLRWMQGPNDRSGCQWMLDYDLGISIESFLVGQLEASSNG